MGINMASNKISIRRAIPYQIHIFTFARFLITHILPLFCKNLFFLRGPKRPFSGSQKVSPVTILGISSYFQSFEIIQISKPTIIIFRTTATKKPQFTLFKLNIIIPFLFKVLYKPPLLQSGLTHHKHTFSKYVTAFVVP